MASGTAVGTPTGQGHGAMQVDPVSGAVLGGRLEQVYVYEAPVRIWHWVMMIAMFILIPTGYLIGSPWSGPRGDAALSYFFGNVRVIHFCAGMIFAVAFAVRVYWAIVGNHHARAIFIPPVWSGRWWKGMFSQAKYYLFIKRESALWIGHNPLAQFAMFAMYVLGSVVIIVTGLALYAEQWGWGSSWMHVLRLGVRAVRRAADGPHRAPSGDVVPDDLRDRPHVHGVPRGHHEQAKRGRDDDQRSAYVQGRRAHREGLTAHSNMMMATRSSQRGQPASLGIPARRPPQPGQFLESRFLAPLGISQTALAKALGVSRRRVNELINGRRAITPDTAVRLGLFFKQRSGLLDAPAGSVGYAHRGTRSARLDAQPLTPHSTSPDA